MKESNSWIKLHPCAKESQKLELASTAEKSYNDDSVDAKNVKINGLNPSNADSREQMDQEAKFDISGSFVEDDTLSNDNISDLSFGAGWRIPKRKPSTFYEKVTMQKLEIDSSDKPSLEYEKRINWVSNLKKDGSEIEQNEKEHHLEMESGIEMALNFLTRNSKKPSSSLKRLNSWMGDNRSALENFRRDILSSFNNNDRIYDQNRKKFLNMNEWSFSPDNAKSKREKFKKNSKLQRSFSMPKHEKRTQEKLEIKSIILKKESNKAKKQVRFADVEGQGPLIQVIRERRKKLRKKQKQVEKVQKSKNSWAWIIF